MSQIFAENIEATSICIYLYTHCSAYVCVRVKRPFPSGLTTGTMTEVGVALRPVVLEALVMGGPTETGQ